MRDFLKEYSWDGRDFLVCGKGPSFRVHTETERTNYNIIGLNHAVRESHCNLAHIIDIDVLDNLGDKLLENCDYVVMPYYPHLGWRPQAFLTLQDLCEKHPVLSKMKDRVYGYNLSTASTMLNLKWNDSELVWASYFSAEAVVNMLGKLGAKRIRTLGVDGGKGQSEAFKDLQNVNTNGYDAEWVGIRKSIEKFGIDYAPLGVESPIRIFIGAGEAQLVPALVLKHTILKHATMSTEVTIMNDWTHPMPKDARNMPRTPFSFQRFMIPEKNNGMFGIYMDSDMLVFGDVKELWSEPSYEGLLTMRNDDIDKHRAKFAVCRYDNYVYHPTIKEIVDGLDSGKWSYEDIVFDFKHEVMGIRDGFNPDWNSLEEYTEGKTKLLHYTEFWGQPWHANPNHPLAHLWFDALKTAFACGEVPDALLQSHVERRWIVPKCLEVCRG